MRLDLRAIISQPGSSLPFSFSMDLSKLEWNGSYPVPEPVPVSGMVENEAGALILRCQMSAELQLKCDRCLKPFSREKQVSYETLLAPELEQEDSDDIVLLEDGFILDAGELLREVFVLSLDTRYLCSEDCKGLCPGCGADLNVEPCRCTKQVDPRLAPLAKLLAPED